jgi:hypothetical protein
MATRLTKNTVAEVAAPISDLSDIGILSAQIGYSRFAVRPSKDGGHKR